MAKIAVDKIETEIKKIVAEILETEPEKIASDAKFVEDLGMDSMMALEIMAAIEKKYRIAIPEDMLPKFTTLDQTVSLIKEIVSKK
ncbi:MAG: phosphopantetheine-binding protein [Candidatus Omnitrophica bacterium]|nr:phosphopantetheine-binding protein [Candidatus Omnitrophota bacterium]HOX53964.1 phosphopantetheine-binding protein [Candidatus Omnitrophota bacterium]